MLKLFIFMFACGSATLIITQSKIFQGVRDAFGALGDFFKDLINCPQCTGVWVGGVVGMLFSITFPYLQWGDSTDLWSWIFNTFVASPIAFVLDGAIASFVAVLMNTILDLIDSINLLNVKKIQQQDEDDLTDYMYPESSVQYDNFSNEKEGDSKIILKD